MNVFLRELKAYRRSMIIWIVSLSAISIIFLMIFPSFTSDVETLRKLMSTIPEAVRKAVSLSFENFFTIYGFMGYILTYVFLAGAIQAMNLGIGVVSKEESGKTSDFLLTKPISRFRVLTNKLAAVLFVVITTSAIFSFVSYITALIVSPDSFNSRTFLLEAMILLIIQIIFLSVGFCLGAILPKVKSAISITLPTVFGVFIVGALGAILGSELSRYLCPFKYFTVDYIIKNNNYETKYLIISLAVVVVSIIVGYLAYIKKDLRAAA